MLSAILGKKRLQSPRLWCLSLFALAASHIDAADWPKIDKAELAETTPKIDAEAGAEILVDDVVLNYRSLDSAEETRYIRAKIFSPRGVEHFSLVKIAYKADQSISELAARTITPAGYVVEVKSKDIHSREEFRDHEGRLRTKTFALPALEVGAVVEYKYRIYSTKPKFAAAMVFQNSLPTRLVRYKVGLPKLPPQYAGTYHIRALSYLCANQKLVPKNGFFSFEFKDLPAVISEPLSPPVTTSCPSMHLFYSDSKRGLAADFWRKYSKDLYKEHSSTLRITPAIAEKAREIVGAAKTDEAKLKAIYEWCRTHITNLSRETTHLTAEERKALKENESAAEVLATGKGNEVDINLLFISLAMAAGFDARVAMCNNRFEFRYEENITEPVLVFSDLVAAVHMEGDWKYFDPGATYLSFGQLSSKNTETALLVSDPNAFGHPTMIEGEPSNANCIQRKADLRLSFTGAIEGDVLEIYSGQENVNLKYFLEDKSPDKCAELFRKKILRQFKDARVTNVVVENAAGSSAILRVSYHLRIQAYAAKTGSRMFFQPAVFQKGGVKRLTLPDGERYNPLQFPYRFQMKDEIHIVLPSGYDMETTNQPLGLDIDGFGDHDVEINLNRVTRTVTYKREFNLSKILFPTSVYPKMKDVLTKIRERDDYTLSLKRDETIDIPQAVSESEGTSDEPDSKSPLDDDDEEDMDLAL